MTLPVSSYEALLLQVRELTHETILLQQQLSADLIDNVLPSTDVNHNLTELYKNYENGKVLIGNVIHRDRSRYFETGPHPFADRNSLTCHPHPTLLDTVPEALNADELTAKLLIWRDSLKNRENKEETPLRRGKQQHQTASGTFYPDESDLPAVYQGVNDDVTSTYLLGARQHQNPPVTSKDYPKASLQCTHKRHNDNVMDPTGAKEIHQKPEIYQRTRRCYDEEQAGSSEDDVKVDDTTEGNKLSSLYHGTWPVKRDTWTTSQGFSGQTSTNSHDMASVMSFSSGSGCSGSIQGHRRLGAKVDVVYSLLGMLGSTEGREDMSGTLLAMSNSIDSCLVMRQSGCLPLLVQLIHAPGQDQETRERASRALHNVIHARSDEKIGRREARVLRLLEQVRDYCQILKNSLEIERPPDDLERHPGPTIAALMKLSFDEAHRHAMCQLGGLHAVAELIEMDHAAHGSDSDDQSCITLRRYAGMALTNLTFGDGNNKALLCSFKEFMKALVTQLKSSSDDLRQVTASVLRNLSWRADSSSKQTLREVGAVTGLMKAAMEGRKESTLKSILSALWNLSAHCSTNKVDICAVEGALAFLVDMLSYKAPSKTLAIVENAGGILRNVSSHIAVREDYRAIVRERGCLQVLLRQLRSPSLTVVSNSCGALWNLSARCSHDQRLLWDLGAVPMLRSLVHSKHKMISMGSSAALKNLLSARPGGSNLSHLDSTTRGLGLPTLPTLNARRQRALEQEIDQNLSETCDNIEPSTSPINKDDKFTFKEPNDVTLRKNYQVHHGINNTRYNGGGVVPRSESRESMRSITSTHSDTIFERVHRHVISGLDPTDYQIKQQSSSLHSAVASINGKGGPLTDIQNKTNQLEKKYALKYKNATVPAERLRPTSSDDVGIAGSTISWATGPDQDSACSLLRASIEEKLSPLSSSSSTTTKSDINDSFTKLNNLNARSPLVVVNPSAAVADNFTSNYPFDTAGNFIRKPVISSSPTLSHSASESDPFGDYAETDLDQPTNYSLRYAEKNSDEDEKQSSGYFAGSEQLEDIEDTVKTYYTEGTPYETSLNSSRATSHSDLQDDSRIKHYILERHQLNKLEHEEIEIISKIKDVPLRSLANRNSFIERTDTKRASCSPLSTASKRLSLPPNSIDINSDIDSGVVVPGEIEENESTESEIIIESTVTRLSSLIINDDDDDYDDDNDNDTKGNIDKRVKKHDIRISQRQNCAESESLTESIASDDGDEDDEDLLAACIHVGMQNNRHRQSFRRSSLEKTTRGESNLARYQTSVALDQVDENNFSKNSNQSELDNKREDSTIDAINFDDKFKIFENNLNIKELNVVENPDKERICLGDVATADSVASVEDNEYAEQGKCDQAAAAAGSDTVSSESIDSYDSVERSEQVLLELCIKSAPPNTDETDTIIPKFTSDHHHDGLSLLLSRDKRYTHPESVSDEINGDEYRRQRDPDAMIASLDRLTATLVQQTEAMRERDSSSSTMKQSIQSDTWNEDSPNDNSFPTISMSVPLVASFKSDTEEDKVEENFQTISENSNSNDLNYTMSTSKIIEQEAFKLAEAVDAEFGEISMTSHDLEAIKPPSTMGSLVSLTTSYAGPESIDNSIVRGGDYCYSTSLPPSLLKSSRGGGGSRKKSLPIGMVAKRALGGGGQLQNYTVGGSLESLLNDTTTSQLENVMPPSMMDELFDTGDLENSMLSVESIISEIADSRDQQCDSTNSLTISDPVYDLVKPVANVLSLTCLKYAESGINNSLSEYLENINPPSLFNEISEIDDTTIDANTDTMCSDTLCIDVDLRTEEEDEPPLVMMIDRIENVDNDTDEAATPIPTEYSSYSSSAESTPKKRLYKNHLTPKQKRQLAKERYKTYTIAAELVKKEEEERRKQHKGEHNNNNDGGGGSNRSKSSPFTKLTPKQRRQENRERFQTRVLKNPLGDINQFRDDDDDDDDDEENKKIDTTTVAIKTGIPSLKNLADLKTFNKKNRIENKERYRTKTLNDDAERGEEKEEEGMDQVTTSKETLSDKVQTMFEPNSKISHNINDVDESISEIEAVNSICSDSVDKKFLTWRRKNPLSTDQKKEQKEEVEEDRAIGDTTSSRIQENPKDINDSPDCSDCESDNETKLIDEQQPKRPRIVKPGNRDIGSGDASNNHEISVEPSSPKGIRGRRKALYSSPNTRKTTPQSSPIKHGSSGIPIGRSNTSPVVRTTRAMTLKQNTSTHLTRGAATSVIPKNPMNVKHSGLSKRSSIPQRGSTSVVAAVPPGKTVKRHSTPPGCCPSSSDEQKAKVPKPLERQGTFTKDEPEMENAPTVMNSPSKSKLLVKPRDSPSKILPVNSKISVRNSYQSKLTKCASADGIISNARVTTSLGKRQTAVAAASVEIGSKNEQIIRDDSKKLTNFSQRSNSNSSITSQNIAGGSKKLTREATSKIASLWKKVEESRSKQKNEKADSRQWITAGGSSDKTNDANLSQKQPSKFRLFRSSTFEGVPKESGLKLPKNLDKLKETNRVVSGPNYPNSYDSTNDVDNGSNTVTKIPKFNKNDDKDMRLGFSTVVLRKQKSEGSECDTKRISRLGSFFRVDSENQQRNSDFQVSTTIVVNGLNSTIECETVNGTSDIGSINDEVVNSSSQITTV